MAVPEEVELGVQLLILGMLIWLVYTRDRGKGASNEVPDYIEEFTKLAPDALLTVIEQRKTTVEEAVLEDLPLEEIKTLEENILNKFEELEELKTALTDDNEKFRNTNGGRDKVCRHRGAGALGGVHIRGDSEDVWLS